MADKSITNEYAFSRSITSSIRLNYQQYLWRKSFPHLLHPSIHLPPKNAAIADIACGTGIWLLELSDQLAASTNNQNTNVTFTGFDVSLSQIPSRGAFFPPNISFQHLDILKPLPSDLEGKFDIVNLQFLNFVLGSNETLFHTVLHNLTLMLKPGGYLQWSEIDRSSRHFHHAYPSSSTTTAIEAGFGGGDVGDARAQAGDWVPRMAEHFQAAGLVETVLEKRETPRQWLGMNQLNALAAFDEFLGVLEEGSEYRERLVAGREKMYEDVGSGGAADFTQVLAIGKKAG